MVGVLHWSFGASVIPVLVTGIQRTASAGACWALDPGNECRDDSLGGSHRAHPIRSSARPWRAGCAALAAILGATIVVFSPLHAPAHAAQTNAPAGSNTPIEVETVADGLENPWGLQFLPDGRMIVTERPGRIRIVGKDGKLSAPVAGVPKVHARGQGGLLDIRLSADFSSSGILFLSYAEPNVDGTSQTAVARARLKLAADPAGGGSLSDIKVIFRQQPAQNTSHHFGSRIVPAKDGTLFVTTGDRGNGNLAQQPGTTVGKVVRIDAEGKPAADNPKKPGWAPEVWSIGHRSVQGAAVDPATGELWTVEHGARGGDELNNPRSGRNYGWPVITYGRNYNLMKIGEGTGKEGMEQPVYYWDPSIATSGLAIVQGDLFPGWKGSLLVGGLAGARIARLTLSGGEVQSEEVLLGNDGMRIRDVREGPDGAIYALVDEAKGLILRITPADR